MSDITPVGSNHPAAATRLNPAGRANPLADAAGTGRGRDSDSVQLSTVARMLSKINQLPDVRQDLVDQVRSEIQAGTYLTDDKLDGAMQGLMDDLTGTGL